MTMLWSDLSKRQRALLKALSLQITYDCMVVGREEWAATVVLLQRQGWIGIRRSGTDGIYVRLTALGRDYVAARKPKKRAGVADLDLSELATLTKNVKQLAAVARSALDGAEDAEQDLFTALKKLSTKVDALAGKGHTEQL